MPELVHQEDPRVQAAAEAAKQNARAEIAAAEKSAREVAENLRAWRLGEIEKFKRVLAAMRGQHAEWLKAEITNEIRKVMSVEGGNRLTTEAFQRVAGRQAELDFMPTRIAMIEERIATLERENAQ